jgi:PRTRC genetic system protein B
MIRIADEDLQKWLMSIHIYEESIFVSQLDPKTGAKKEFEVSAVDLANRMNLTAKLSTGLMKPNTIFYKDDGVDERIVIYAPRAIRQLHIDLSRGKRQISVPMPPMVFWNVKNRYFVAALTGDEISPKTKLAAAPVPNVHENGEICAGNVKFPKGGMRTIREAERLFWESEFNGDLANKKCKSYKDVRDLYKSLKARTRFPTRELVELDINLGELIEKLQQDTADMNIEDEE